MVALSCLSLVMAEPGGSYGDSRFRAQESHVVTSINTGARKGWQEHTRDVQFGAFGFRVVQRIDPKTGFPPARRTWGDSFFGVRGHKEKRYFSANWSPWAFLAPQIQLAGSAKALPSPTLYGRCEFAGIRERSPRRIVAEALFRDTAGGWLRVRFIGLASCRDRFGVAAAYTPPDGKAVASLTYQLICQPHDYSDRGYWQRQRTVTTPSDSIALPDKAERRFSPADGPWLLHNRLAHTTSGTFLDRCLNSVASVTTRGAGHTITIDLEPADLASWTTFVCGDWIGEHWRLRGDRLFREAPAVTEARASRLFATPALPAALTELGPELARIGKSSSPDVSKSVERRQDALNALQAADTAQNLSEFAAATAALMAAVRSLRADWVTAKRWREAE